MSTASGCFPKLAAKFALTWIAVVLPLRGVAGSGVEPWEPGLLLLRLVAKGLPEGDPCERQHPFRVGRKDLEEWRRTSKYVLPCCIEPGAPP